MTNLHIGHIGMNRRCHVGRERPRRCRPDQKCFPRSFAKGKSQCEPYMRHFAIALRHYLVLGERRGAAGTPRHHVSALVYPSAFVAFLEDRPDCVVVLVGEGEV